MARPDDLFRTYFAPWYPPERPPAFGGVLPDVEQIVLDPGQHIGDIHPLEPEARALPAGKIEEMFAAFTEDGVRLLGATPPVDLAWIEAVDDWLSPDRARRILAQSQPHEFSNAFLVLCCEFGAGVGEVLRQLQPGAQWIPDWPYWDSWIFDLNSRTKCNVFHWVVKRFHEDGGDERLADKVGAALRFMREHG